MADFSISARMPSGKNNGLPGLIAQMVADPGTPRLVIGVLNVRETKRITDTGDQVPILRWLAIEPVVDNGDIAHLRRLLERLVEARTGETMLPLEFEQAIEEALSGGVDNPEGDEPAA